VNRDAKRKYEVYLSRLRDLLVIVPKNKSVDHPRVVAQIRPM
jgi:hypothetical protein